MRLRTLLPSILCLLCASYSALADIPVVPGTDLNLLLRTAKPGDVFVLEDGTYPGGIFVSDRPGTQAAPIFFIARNAGKAVISGPSATKPNAFSLLRCHWWRVQGIVFEKGVVGLQVGTSNDVIVSNCTARNNIGQGMLVSGQRVTVENSDCFGTVNEHGIYFTGALEGGVIRNNHLYSNGKSGAQVNAQGSGGLCRNFTIEGNSIYNCGANGAAGLNLIGLVQSKVQNNTINDCVATGIALSGGSTGNLIYGNLVTFRSVQSRQCITSSDSLPVTNSVANNICRMAKPVTTAPAIEAKGASTFILADNTILPIAPPIAVTPLPTPTPVPDPIISPVPPPP